MRERPGQGVGHWANYNPSLRAALRRGDTAKMGVPTPAAPPVAAPVHPWVQKNREIMDKVNGMNNGPVNR